MAMKKGNPFAKNAAEADGPMMGKKGKAKGGMKGKPPAFQKKAKQGKK